MPPNENDLSERENEILRLVSTGASNKQIAQQLVISTNTVKVHLRNIFAKIGVTSRTEATLYAIRNGLVQQVVHTNVQKLDDYEPGSGELSRTDFKDQAVPAKRRNAKQYIYFGSVLLALSMFVFFIYPLITHQPLWNSLTGETVITPVPQQVNRWQIRANMPEGLSRAATAVYNSEIFVFGGIGPAGLSTKAYRYSPQSNNWSSITPKTTPVFDSSAVSMGEKIYIPGGNDGNGHPVSTMDVYDPRKDSWETRANLPIALSKFGLAAYNGKIYLFGGWDGRKYLSSVYIYNPAENSWTQGTDCPVALGSPGIAVGDTQIYLIGGNDGVRALGRNDVYYPDRDGSGEKPWVTKKSFPGKNLEVGVTNLADTLYVIGGLSDRPSNLSWMYSLDQDSWSAFDTSQLNNLTGFSVVGFDNYIYILGGETSSKAESSAVVSYQALYTIDLPILSH